MVPPLYVRTVQVGVDFFFWVDLSLSDVVMSWSMEMRSSGGMMSGGTPPLFDALSRYGASVRGPTAALYHFPTYDELEEMRQEQKHNNKPAKITATMVAEPPSSPATWS